MANLQLMTLIFVLGLLLSSITGEAALGSSAPEIRWGHQLMSPTNDSLFGTMVADSNNGIYIAISRKPLSGSGHSAKDLIKFNQQGAVVWTKPFWKPSAEDASDANVQGLAVDDRGDLYVFGYTDSILGKEHQGGYDAFVDGMLPNFQQNIEDQNHNAEVLFQESLDRMGQTPDCRVNEINQRPFDSGYIGIILHFPPSCQ